MQSRFATGLAALALAALAACETPAAMPAALTDADIAAISAVTDEFRQNVLAGNFAGVAALYTEDGMLLPPNAPAVTGRPAIQQYLESFPPVTNFNFTIAEVAGVGDMAWVRGSYTMTLAPPGADPMTDSGKFIEIRERQADGRWLLTRDIFNSDLPLPGM